MADILERRELARRLVFLDDQLRGGVYLRCDIKGRGTDEDPSRPVIAGLVPHWMSRQHPTADGAMIIHVPGSVVLPALPRGAERVTVNRGCLTDKWLAKLRKFPEHERQRLLWQAGLEFGDFDTWAKPVAVQASGLQSYAHTALLYYDELDGSNYDPLASSPAWTLMSGTDYLKQVAASSLIQGDTNSAPACLFRWDTTAQPPNDCSVTSRVTGTGVNQSPGIIGRMSDNTHFYMLRITWNASNSVFQLYKNDAELTLLGSFTLTGVENFDHHIRLEMVGGVLKGYVGTSEPLTERISVPDAILTAGWAGIRTYATTTSQPTWAYMGLYVLAAAAKAYFYREQVCRRRF